MICSQEVPGFILEHHFTSKSFTAGCKTFHHMHPDKEVPNKTIFRLMEKFCKQGMMAIGNIPYILESNPHPNLIHTQFLAIS